MTEAQIAEANARLRDQSLDGEFDVLRDDRQKASFVSGDGVARHAQLRGEFALCETETEPSDIPKLPAGQAGSGYLREHDRSLRRGRQDRRTTFDRLGPC